MHEMKSQSPHEPAKPFVSVIVPVFNDEHRIGKCIEALEGQTYPHDRYEIIVVDNGSTDETRKVVERYSVILLVEDRVKSSYAARNKGIQKARGEVIALTDADCIPSPDWIEKGVAHLLSTPNCGLVGGRITLFFKDQAKPNAFELYESITTFRQKEDVELHRFGSTANVFTFKKVVDHVGFFKDALKSGGDNEWGRRVFSYGYRQIYAHDAIVAHPARHSLKQIYKRMTRLVGGNFDQRKSTFQIVKFWLRNIRSSMGLIVRTILGMPPSDQLNGTSEKIKVIFAGICIECICNYERLRLLTGGSSKRW